VAVGRPTESVADHVAFMALAQSTQSAECAPSRTILDLMVAGCLTDESEPRLSQQDFAFLRALYTVNPEQNASQQRGAIVLQMSRPPESR
jgi:hypothetical protein